MKLSETTIAILKNFSTINPNILFRPGQAISTIAEAKNIMAVAKIEEMIPSEFGVYDLTEFLSTLSLLEAPELEFQEDSLTMREKNASIQYFYSGKELLTVPTKSVTMPKAELQICLKEDDLNKVKRAAAVLGHSNLEISGKNGVIKLEVVDPKNPTANKYSLIIEEENPCTAEFSFVIVIGNLKIIPGIYEVSISSKLISHFKNTSIPVEYWIALEKTSTFSQ